MAMPARGLRRAGLDAYASLDLPPRLGRRLWIEVARGDATVNGRSLDAGGSLAVRDEPRLTLTGGNQAAERLFFDLD